MNRKMIIDAAERPADTVPQINNPEILGNSRQMSSKRALMYIDRSGAVVWEER